MRRFAFCRGKKDGGGREMLRSSAPSFLNGACERVVPYPRQPYVDKERGKKKEDIPPRTLSHTAIFLLRSQAFPPAFVDKWRGERGKGKERR